MEISGQLIATIGIMYWMLLFLSVLFGWLRSDKVLIVHAIISCVMLYFGLQFLPLNLPCMGNENGAGFLFGPFVFVVGYSLLRGLYKKIFKFEPDFEAYTGYSNRDKRGLNFMDYFTFFIPTTLSAIVNIMMAN